MAPLELELNVYFLIGFIVTILVGVLIGPILSWLDIEPWVPPDKTQIRDSWRDAVRVNDARLPTFFLGMAECLLFYVAFWANQVIAIGGWLAFKVATKWYAWQHITKIPERLDDVAIIDFLRMKNVWATRVATRFLIGTLLNVASAVIGLAVALVARNICDP